MLIKTKALEDQTKGKKKKKEKRFRTNQKTNKKGETITKNLITIQQTNKQTIKQFEK